MKVVYEIGDVFNIEGYGSVKAMLCQINGGHIIVMDLLSGNRFNSAKVEVKCVHSITEQELRMLFYGCNYKYIGHIKDVALTV